MRFFVWLDFQYEMAALFLGAVSVILAYAAWASYPRRRMARTMEEMKGKSEQGPERGHHEEKTPVGPFLIYIYLLIGAWTVSYLIFVWANGSRF